MKKRPGFNFKQWKRGYEAQHILPWAEVMKFQPKFDDNKLNEHWNGMMLPSGRKGALKPVYKAGTRFKNRPFHIKKGWAHPKYSEMVHKLLLEKTSNGQKDLTLQMAQKLAEYLRQKTKNHKGWIDDM